MAYEKQNFTDGKVLTAAQLNHIEDGIAEVEKNSGGGGIAPLIVTLSEETGKASHTAGDIFDYVENGGTAVLYMEGSYIPVSHCSIGTAEFSAFVEDQDYVYGAVIFEDGAYVRIAVDIITDTIYNERIGDLDTALANILDYSQSLVGGGES